MILDWLGQAPVLLAALAVVFVPGMLAMAAVGLRGVALLASAPLFSVAMTGVTAIIFGAVGIPWSPLNWAIAALILVGAAWGTGRLLHTSAVRNHDVALRWLLPAALTTGILFGVWRLVAYIAEPAGISQTNDAVFHMNAIRFIVDTADASSLHINAFIGGSGFYPSAWHGLVSLVVMLTGAEAPAAANMVSITIGGFIWPFGIAWLARSVTGSTTVASYAAALSGILQTFPLLMFQWGVLFPNALSTSLIPGAISLVIAMSTTKAEKSWRIWVRDVLLVLIAVAALALSQPAALLPWLAICAVWVSYQILRLRPRNSWILAGGALLGIWLVVGIVWIMLSRETSGSHWPPFRGKLESVLDVLLNGQLRIPYAYGISALMLLGLVIAVRRGSQRWFAVSWAGISFLYVLVASAGRDEIRESILGAWYADPYRVAALAPIVVIPLGAIGVDAIVRFIAARHRIGELRFAPWFALLAIAIAMVAVVVLRPVSMPAVTEGTFDRDSRYVAVADSYLDPDERTLLESLDDLVEPDTRVIANPSTGAAFGYSLSGVDVYPRTWAPPTASGWLTLAGGLRDAANDPEICDALSDFGSPQYVLDFGPGETAAGRYEMPGMTDFSGQRGFELVAREGEASLWRITACAQ